MFDDIFEPLGAPPRRLTPQIPIALLPPDPLTGVVTYRVELWNLHSAFVVVAAPTGVIISNQTGGCMCQHPELEGYLVPIPFEDPSESCCDPDLHAISAAIQPFGWVVDINAVPQVEEAWIPVVNHKGQHGFLTYPNCD